MSKLAAGMHRNWRYKALIGLSVLLGAFLASALPAAATENWFEAGLTDLKEGRYQAAVDAFTLAIEAVPGDFEALNNRGFARICTGDYEGAVADCSRSIALNPGSAKAYNNRGFAQLFTGALEPAIRDFDQALALNPRYVDAYSNRALARVRQGDYRQAIADCSEALHLNPRSAKALYNRGFARDRQGDPGGAMRDYIQALKINPDYVEVFNNMAWIMATSPDERLRDGRRAVAYAEKAAGSRPDINFLDTLAAAYAEAGRFDEAVAIENRIIALLASTRQADAGAVHMKRMRRYEEGQPYREPMTIQPVSAVTDLKGELATLDRLVFAPEMTAVAYEPAESARNFSTMVLAAAESADPGLLAQAESNASVTVPEAYNQSIRTAPGVPVEISLAAEPEGIPLTFEIETVPYQGALQGTLPNLLYTPRPGFEGVDRFTFRARNAAGLSNLATITITVAEPPDMPVAEESPAAPEGAADRPPSQEAPAPPAAPSAEETPKPAPVVPVPAVPDDLEEMEPGTADAPPMPANTETPAGEPASEPDLSPEAHYTIQVRSVKEAAGADAIVTRFAEEGYAAFTLAVEVPEKGQWHRVFIGSYPSMAAARAALAKLDPERFKDAFIRRMPGGARLPAAAPAPEPALPAAAPEPEVSVPAVRPAPEPAVPADDPAPQTERPAAAPAPEPRVPAPSVEPSALPPDPPASDSGPPRDLEGQAVPVGDIAYPYAYQIKSYKQREDAFQLAMELTAQGHNAFIGRATLGTTGVWYRVFVGCYPTPEEAENGRHAIVREGFPEAFLTSVAFAIAVSPAPDDPAGEILVNRLVATGFRPYRLPETTVGPPTVLVGGFRAPDDAAPVLAALEQSGFRARLRPR